MSLHCEGTNDIRYITWYVCDDNVFRRQGVDHAAEALDAGTAHFEDGFLARPQLQKSHRRILRGAHRSLLVGRANTLQESITYLAAALHVNTHPTLGTDNHSHRLATMADTDTEFRMLGQIWGTLLVMFQMRMLPVEQTA